MSGLNNNEPPGGGGLPPSVSPTLLSNVPQLMSGLAIGNPATTAPTAPPTTDTVPGPAAPAATGAGIVVIPTVNLANAPAPSFNESQHASFPPPANPYTHGNPASVAPTLSTTLSKLSDKLDYPVRTSLGEDKSGKRNVLSNHFDITVDPKTKFFEYKVIGIPAAESRANKRRQYRHYHLMDQLHQHATGPQTHNGHITTGEGAEWRLIDVTDPPAVYSLNVQFIRYVDIAGLREFANTNHPNPTTYDPSSAENALNIVMKHAIGNI
ncbi:hypothetical protein EK21DRAFT_117602 [Setomelanomma holmii]|uniref:Uncharacterized protein n=1 Tax=Setomelanomma holmii TaxID=210430 RepID=A0A9P4GXS9_9PLEO|nr:hypothetical protein EK21DRAFT_117602 [Setomelanomma holmii]